MSHNEKLNDITNKIKDLYERQDILDNTLSSIENKTNNDHSFNEEENILEKQLWSGIPSGDIDNFNKSIEKDIRPQMSSKLIGESLKELKSHELDFINNLKTKEMDTKKSTILDENLGNIIDNTINFIVHFINDFHKYVYEAEVSEKTILSKAGIFTKIKIYLLALIYYIRESENVIYLGFLLIFISIIIFFLTIII